MSYVPQTVLPVINDYCHYGAVFALENVLKAFEGVDQYRDVFDNGQFTRLMNSTAVSTKYSRDMVGAEFDMYVDHSMTLPDYNELTLRYSELSGLDSLQNPKHTHILVIQWDGFINDPSSWASDFLDYDYIGAPWYWEKQYQVGNGGFSLRSFKLLAALAELHKVIPFNFNNPEDVTICRDYREMLETKYDIKFAPLEAAKKFSFETGIAETEPFGFHGVWNKIYYSGWDDSILDRDIHTMETRNIRIYNVHHLQHMIKALFVVGDIGDYGAEAELYQHIAEHYPEHVEYLLHYRQSLDKMPASSFDTWSIL